METIITWAKENFDLICLGVGVLGVLIGIISVIQAKKQANYPKRDKANNEEFLTIFQGKNKLRLKDR